MHEWTKILTTLFFWAFLAGVVLGPLYFRHQARRQAHQTMRALIAQGREISPETIIALQGMAENPTPRPERYRNAGYIVVSVGLGGLIFAAALASALLWNNQVKGASMAGPIIASLSIAIGIIGASLILIARRIGSPSPSNSV